MQLSGLYATVMLFYFFFVMHTFGYLALTRLASVSAKKYLYCAERKCYFILTVYLLHIANNLWNLWNTAKRKKQKNVAHYLKLDIT